MNRVLILSFISLCIYACNNHKELREYYESGNLKTKYDYFDSAACSATYYYESGQIKSKGQFVNNTKTGQWKEYYTNGELRWEGKYPFDIMDFITNESKKIIFVDNNKEEKLKVNQDYKIKIKIPSEYFQNTSVSVDNGKVLPNDDGSYDYLLQPEKAGNIEVVLYLNYNGELYEIRTLNLIVTE